MKEHTSNSSNESSSSHDDDEEDEEENEKEKEKEEKNRRRRRGQNINRRQIERKPLAQSAHLLSPCKESNCAIETTLAKFSSASGCVESKIEQKERGDDVLREGYSRRERIREFRR